LKSRILAGCWQRVRRAFALNACIVTAAGDDEGNDDALQGNTTMLDPRLSWPQKLEALKQELLAAANDDGGAASIELLLVNHRVRVRVVGGTSIDRQSAIAKRALHRFHKLCPKALKQWDVVVEFVHSFPYTSHLTNIAATQAPAEEIVRITLIDVTKAGLTALRNCYDTLRLACSAYDYAATFALGGIPAIQHITKGEVAQAMELPANERSAAAAKIEERFHLLPGLLWSTDAESYFLNWIAGLPIRSRVILFDTGHSGNGPRQMFRLLKENVSTINSFGPAEILLRGIADKVNDDQVKDSAIFESAGGDQVRVSIDYVHVPQIVTEDLPKLIGFDSHRHELSAESVAEAGVLRILDKDGKEIATVGAVRAADLMAAANKMPDAAAHSDDLSRATAFMLLPLLKDRELEALRCALSLGWVSNDEFEAQKLGLEEKYKAFAEKEIFYKWNPQALKNEKLKPGK